MGEIQSKRFDEPDEVLSLPNLTGQILILGEWYVGRYIHDPGWCWSKDVKPQVGTTSCEFHHLGIALAGSILVTTTDGAQRTISTGEAYDIPPGHDACVVGDEPFIAIDFLGARDWARSTVEGERILASLLFTDIVGSTAIATRLGDIAWMDLLSRHNDRVRMEIDRFRGYESKTTGDGFLAVFDSASQAARCAAEICRVARKDGIEVRTGVHSGEVKRYPDSVQGLAVHVAARIAALAGPGEVLLSASTVALLEGSSLSFVDAGEHELRGVEGKRRIYRLVTDHSI